MSFQGFPGLTVGVSTPPATVSVQAQRKFVADAISDLRSTDALLPLFGLRLGGPLCVLTAGGAVYDDRLHEFVSTKADSDIEDPRRNGPFIHPVLSDLVSPGVLPGGPVGDVVDLPAGVVAIVGPSGVGKTPFAHHLASRASDDGRTYDRIAVVRAGEPFPGYISDARRVCEAVAGALYHADEIVFDSAKDLLSTGGNLMSGGLSRDAFVDLGALSIVASTLGRRVYVPINPSSNDDRVLDLTLEAVRSSVAAVFFRGSATDDWTCEARTGEGLDRTRKSVSFRTATAKTPSLVADVSYTSSSRPTGFMSDVARRARVLHHL